ncbi:MAG: cytochrome bc complex cytochrome b subunit [Alphaproteobacteria bacterium]|nr:cytochrome bc complex cytochrome b subunit [Alphaproteobacteria bacterium]
MIDMEPDRFKNPLVRWIDERLPAFSIFRRHYIDHPTPRYFNKGWNLIVSVMLMIVIVSGLFLAVHYVPHEDHAFEAVERIRRDVRWGWLIHTLHANGASFLFLAMYVHMGRGMLYGAFKTPRELVWIVGVLVLFLMVTISFTGYVLPFGQTGGWAAIVITNALTAIPFVGEGLRLAVLGGDGVGTATLMRFYVWHFAVPFLVLLLVFLHIWSLRVCLGKKDGSRNHYEDPRLVPFHPYHTIKGSLWLCGFLIAFTIVAFFFPDLTVSPGNRVPFDPLHMPDRIAPEWYLLPFYGMLRAVNFGINPYIALSLVLFAAALRPFYTRGAFRAGRAAGLAGGATLLFAFGYLGQTLFAAPFGVLFLVSAKSAGAAAFAGMFAVLLLLPWLDRHPVRNGRARPWFGAGMVLFAAALVALGVSGAMPATAPWVALGQVGAAVYFLWFLAILPVLNRFERGGRE